MWELVGPLVPQFPPKFRSKRYLWESSRAKFLPKPLSPDQSSVRNVTCGSGPEQDSFQNPFPRRFLAFLPGGGPDSWTLYISIMLVSGEKVPPHVVYIIIMLVSGEKVPPHVAPQFRK